MAELLVLWPPWYSCVRVAFLPLELLPLRLSGSIALLAGATIDLSLVLPLLVRNHWAWPAQV